MSEPRVLSGRYELQSVLGRGGMADVYLGTDRVLGRRIAVKVLAERFARDSSFVARFRREAQSAAALSHPNVVSVFDTGSDDGTHFIVMEYVQGRTLAQVIDEDGPLLPQRAAEVAQAVAEALGFAHRAGIVHRDVKPANIMLTPSGDVKVMDFGIARAATGESLTQTATVLGTATYFSPEQAQGATVDARSDLYSLGAVLYEMLTGQPPFTGESAVSIAYKHVREDPVPPGRLNPDVPPDLEAIVMKLLAKNPANRYQSAEELVQDLERFRAGLPVLATPLLPPEPTELVERATRPTSVLPAETTEGVATRRRWVAGLILGGILLLFAVALLFLARSLLSGPDLVAVPNVVGRQFNVARDILQRAGFRVGPPEFRDSDRPKNEVLDYRPKRAERGAVITLILSNQSIPPPVTVPDVVCEDVDMAELDLRDVGLQPEVVGTRKNEACEPGTVARQDPGAGEAARRGDTVRLWTVPLPPPSPSPSTSPTTPPPTTPPSPTPPPTTPPPTSPSPSPSQ